MIVSIVRFKSDMSDARLLERCEERAPRYRALDGLLQKYYLKYPDGQFGAVYVWESPEALKAFRESDLARSIAAAYEVEGEPSIEPAEVVMTLRPHTSSPSSR
jgi:heme-degrading monooxygenase HmoA